MAAAVMERSLGFAESLFEATDLLRDTPSAGFLVVFSRHSAPLIFKQYLRVSPFDPGARAVINLGVFHLSKQRVVLAYPSSPFSSPSARSRILKLRILAAIIRLGCIHDVSLSTGETTREKKRGNNSQDFSARRIDRAKRSRRASHITVIGHT